METVEQYLQAQPEANRVVLERIRRIVLETLEGSTDSFSYGIIGFRYQKKYVIYISGWKNHLSFHGFSVSLGNDMVAKYPQLKLKGGTLQFQAEPELPEGLIRELVLARVAEIGL